MQTIAATAVPLPCSNAMTTVDYCEARCSSKRPPAPDHKPRRPAPGENHLRNDNSWPGIVALAGPGGGAIGILLNVLALLRRSGSISLG